MLVFLLILVSKMAMTEARVYCQDRHSTPWTARGFSCVVTCNTVLSAVDRLKQSDYLYLINEQGIKPTDTLNMTKINEFLQRQRGRRHSQNTKPTTAQEKYVQTFMAYSKMVPSGHLLAEFQRELTYLTAGVNMTCYVNANTTTLLRKVLNDCTILNVTRGYMLKKFHKFLNNFAHPDYQFDIAMTLIIIKHLLSNVNFRYSNMMENILLFLNRELKPLGEKPKKIKFETIALHTGHCMSIFVPGCFCKQGYVEDQGRCLKPKQCSKDPVFIEYLQRITIR